MKIERPIIALDFPDREACRNFLKNFLKKKSCSSKSEWNFTIPKDRTWSKKLWIWDTMSSWI